MKNEKKKDEKQNGILVQSKATKKEEEKKERKEWNVLYVISLIHTLSWRITHAIWIEPLDINRGNQIKLNEIGFDIRQLVSVIRFLFLVTIELKCIQWFN